MDGLPGDLRHGLRMLVRTPLLSVVAILTIGLGVGGVTFGFSVMYATLYRDLPVRDADRLVVVWQARPEQGVAQMGVPYHDYLDAAEAVRSFERFEAFYGGTVNLASDDGPPERFQGAFVTAGTLGMLGVAPLLGRTFAEREDGPGAPALAVLSHTTWRNRFAADPGVVGRSVRLNGEPAEIVGVMPEGFGFPMREGLWTNLRLDPATLGRREGVGLEVVAYLREAVGVDAAAAELGAVARRIEAAHPEENEGVTFTVAPFVEGYTPPEIRMMVTLMMVMVAGVLLVACANVANVLLARAVVREREVAVRSALGADRWRVVRQLLTEAAVLGVVGGVVGLAVAWGAIALLERAIQDVQRPYWIDFELDPPVLAFTSLVTLLAALGAGSWPALRASGASLGTVLRDESRGSSSRRTSRLASALVVGEIAVSCGLMIAGGLTVRALMDLNTVELGFDADRVMTARLGLFESDYPDEEARDRFFNDLLDRLRGEGGVEAAAISSGLPGTPGGRGSVEVEGQVYADDASRPRAATTWVSDGYFETMGLGATAGRTFLRSEAERGGDAVVVVSEAFAARHLGGSDAVGRRIRVGREEPWLRVVGVVPDVHPGVSAFGGGGELPRDAVYLPLGRGDLRFASVSVRAQGAATSVAGALRGAVAAVDPNLPLYWVRTLRVAVDEGATFHRIFGALFGIVAGAALFLAAVGLYGVIDASVGHRVRELGVRMALGAERRDVSRLVLTKVAAQLVVGITLGLALGVALAVPLSATLYGVAVWSPAVYAVIVGVIAVTGFAAVVPPLLRALRVEPVVALRA